MSEVWSKWTGHVVNGTFPLRRYLGASDHSGVFLTELSGREPHEVAIKLVHAIPTLVDSHGAQWEAAAELANPNLVQLLEAGQCQLDGLPYLYLVMEYADQTLAQLLEQRAMADEEAREMLLPILDTLAFLHNRNMVQGQLKPANILVVGDTLKLASDTIRNVSEAAASINMVSVYDPPEVHDGSVTTAGDMWALGITLFEALTRSPPIGMDVRREGILLPPDFSPMFRDIVASCLSRRPYDRPKAAELAAKMRGQSLESGADASGADASDRGGDEPDTERPVSIDSSSSLAGADRAADVESGVAEAAAPEASTSSRPASTASRAVSVLDKLVSILGPGSRASSTASQAAAATPDAAAGTGHDTAASDVPAAAQRTAEQPTFGAPVEGGAGVTNRSGGITGPGSGAYVTETSRGGPSGPGAVSDGNAAGRLAGVPPAEVAGVPNRPGGIVGPGSATALRAATTAATTTAAAAGARGTSALGASGPSAPAAAGTAALRGVSSPAAPGVTAPGASGRGATGPGTTGPGAIAPRGNAPIPGAAGAPAGAGRSAVNPPLDASGRYRTVPSPAGSPAAAGGPGANAAPGATDASGRYRSVPGASPPAPGVGAAPGVGSAGATDASGRYRSVPGASPPAPGVGPAPGGGSAGAPDASGRYRAVPGAGAPGGTPGGIDASGRYRTVSTPAPQGSTPNRTSSVVSSGLTSAPGSTTSPPARAASTPMAPSGGAPTRSTSVSASSSTATAAAARAAAAAAESNAANRIAAATGTASSGASRTASMPMPMPMPEQGAVNRSAAPGGARIPATGAHDASALNRPPFAGALPHPGSPAPTAEPVKAQRPAPRPIVIEHFTPESLLPAQTGRHPGANTPQPPAGPPRGPKESNFVASNGASGHVDSPELTPSEVAAALESEPVSAQEPSLPRFLLPLTIGAVVVLALALLGVYVLRTHINSTPPVVETYQDPPLPTQADTTPPGTAAEDSAPAPAVVGSSTLSPGDAATPAAPQGQPTASTAAAMPTAAAAPSEAVSPSETASSSEIHEEIPEIPPRIRESIRGHVRVAVRLIVDKEGSVFAALVDEPGPSRYFEQLAIDAAKKWTFPPLDTTGSRLELVRFDFTRQGATGRVVEIE